MENNQLFTRCYVNNVAYLLDFDEEENNYFALVPNALHKDDEPTKVLISKTLINDVAHYSIQLGDKIESVLMDDDEPTQYGTDLFKARLLASALPQRMYQQVNALVTTNVKEFFETNISLEKSTSIKVWLGQFTVLSQYEAEANTYAADLLLKLGTMELTLDACQTLFKDFLVGKVPTENNTENQMNSLIDSILTYIGDFAKKSTMFKVASAKSNTEQTILTPNQWYGKNKLINNREGVCKIKYDTQSACYIGIFNDNVVTTQAKSLTALAKDFYRFCGSTNENLSVSGSKFFGTFEILSQESQTTTQAKFELFKQALTNLS